MNHPHCSRIPLAWLVAFDELPDQAERDASFSQHLDADAPMQVLHLTDVEPEGHYLECATPLFDEAFVQDLRKYLGAAPGEPALLKARPNTPDSVLATVIYRLVEEHAKAAALELAALPLWYVRAPFMNEEGNLDLLVRAPSNGEALSYWRTHYEGHDFESVEPPSARLVPSTELGPINWDLLV